ncbi:MAG: ABC transporter permease [Lachnospiraceae bacterium]|nr:ABC transporter permease [Lachnospiraceae bacterium]
MLFHILKKDLKRKRTMNVILLLFITMAAAFMASSVSNLIAITGAVDHFLGMANTPDYLTIAISDKKETEIEDFLRNCEFVTEYEVIDSYTVTDEIEVIKCTKDPDRHKYERGNTTSIEPVPDDFLKVFDPEGNLVALNSGEIALPRIQAEDNDLQIGDVLKVTCGSRKMEFTVKTIVKDPVFGTNFMGYKRLFITRQDYEQLTGEGLNMHTLLYCVNSSDMESFLKEYKKNNFQIISNVDKATIKMCYIFDMLIAGIFIVVSICLILISFLILRFTIVFTLQEDYKEIGIMKAVGIKDVSIKGIYLLKYLAIALLGAGIGFWISFPFENFLLAKAIENLITKDMQKNAAVNLLCVAAIVLIVLLFCFISTGKVKKFTAIEAIRNGTTGERYRAANLISLHKRKRMHCAVYMACNDVFCSIKRYLVLSAIFCIGTLLILLPLKAVHTLQDENIIRSFNMQTASVFIDTGVMEQYLKEENDDLLVRDLDQIKEELQKNGMDAQVWAEKGYMAPCYANDPEETVTYYITQQIGKEEDDYDVIDGKVPVLPNEILITEKTAKELSVGIGDSVFLKGENGTEEFIITGIFQSLMNMGNGFRVGKDAEIHYPLSGLLSLQAKIESDLSEEELKEKVQKIFPDYTIETEKEWIDNIIGGILGQMNSILLFILGIVLGINILITVLTMKTLITRERGEIAMLKSIGFSDRTIRCWQSIRILLVLCVSVLLGTLLSAPLSEVSIAPVFAMMGATSMKLVTRPLEAYVIYPLIMLIVTASAAYLCASEVKKVDLKEINTLE